MFQVFESGDLVHYTIPDGCYLKIVRYLRDGYYLAHKIPTGEEVAVHKSEIRKVLEHGV